MHASFGKLFSEIELQRAKTLKSVSHLTQAQLNKPLAASKWSVSQILNHLIAAERLSLMYVQKKYQGVNQISDTGVWEEVKMNFLIISQRLPGIKFKAPKAVIDHTKIHENLNDIIREWDAVRNELKSFLEKVPEAHINRRVYRHVRAGYLNLKHCLIFLREHIIHHTPQIKKLVNQN